MILTEYIDIKINTKTKKHYNDLGYEGTVGNMITVKIEHLTKGCRSEIETICDYCKLNITVLKYSTYIAHRKNIKTDCCDDVDCMKKKREESVQYKYGVSNVNQLEETKEKIRATNQENYGIDYIFQNKEKMSQGMMDKYGVDNPSKSPEIREKRIQTFLNNFGETSPLKNKDIRDKLEQTNLKRYGTKYYIMTEESREKLYSSNMIKYGFKSPLSNKEYNAEFQIKSRQKMYENGTSPCSLAQKYLCELLEGKLNYPVGSLALDVAFPEEMIYFEWDGSGHNLAVQMGDLSQEKFNRKEINRHYFLKNKSWKRIRIVSIKDYMPNYFLIMGLINKAKE